MPVTTPKRYESAMIYQDAFGAEEIAGKGPSAGLHLYVDDVDGLFRRATATGARALQSPTDMFYGDRAAMVQNPFGHIWVLLTHQQDLGLPSAGGSHEAAQ